MIPRTITGTIRDAVSQFPVVTLTGARQSGKTTLLREEFPDYRYVSLESSRAQRLAADDPEAFLVEKGGKVCYAVEIKVSAVFDSHAFAVVNELGDRFGLDVQHRIVVYGGDQTVNTKFGRLLRVADLPQLAV